MRTKTILLFTLLINFNLFSQCPKKLVNWINQINVEYPEENLDRVGGEKIKKIVYNLYSDKYFEPIFKQTFDQVSSKNLKLISHQGGSAKCTNVIPGNWGELTDTATDAITGRTTQSANKKFYSYEKVKEKVIELRRIRKENENMVSKLGNQDANISYVELQSWIDKLDSEYDKILMASEISYLKSLINSNKEKIANQDFETKLTQIIQLKNNYASLDKILDFKIDNSEIYNTLNNDYRKNVERKISDKIDEILEVSTKKDLSAVSLSTMQIVELNDLSEMINDRYYNFSSEPRIKQIEKSTDNAKINLIIKDYGKLDGKVKSSTTVAQLKEIEEKYLKGLDILGVSQVENLVKTVSTQRKKLQLDRKNKELVKVQERKRITEQMEMDSELAESEAMRQLGFKFSTHGLENEEVFANLFKGNFTEIPFKKNSILFRGLISDYIYAFASSCENSLPKNKVQIYEWECKTESVTKNGYGAVVNRYCVDWWERPTGLYTTSELLNASIKIQKMLEGQAYGNAMNVLTRVMEGNSLNPVTDMISDGLKFKSDMKKIISVNGCNNKAFRRFEDNLVRFANEESPLKMDINQSIRSSFYNKNHDFQSFIADLIIPRGMNYYYGYKDNSLSNLKITSRDNQNRPIKITGDYRYSGLSGEVKKGQVELTFAKGVPDCLFLPAHTKDCVKLEKSVVRNFLTGGYLIY